MPVISAFGRWRQEFKIILKDFEGSLGSMEPWKESENLARWSSLEACNPSTQKQRRVEVRKFKASLVYTVGSRPARERKRERAEFLFSKSTKNKPFMELSPPSQHFPKSCTHSGHELSLVCAQHLPVPAWWMPSLFCESVEKIFLGQKEL